MASAQKASISGSEVVLGPSAPVCFMRMPDGCPVEQGCNSIDIFLGPVSGPEPCPSHVWSFETCLNLECPSTKCGPEHGPVLPQFRALSSKFLLNCTPASCGPSRTPPGWRRRRPAPARGSRRRAPASPFCTWPFNCNSLSVCPLCSDLIVEDLVDVEPASHRGLRPTTGQNRFLFLRKRQRKIC